MFPFLILSWIALLWSLTLFLFWMIYVLSILIHTVFMVSFDIDSLFTNIPLDETIDIIINRAFQNSTLFRGFSNLELHKLLCLSVKNCHFILNNSLCEHVDGVAMGSPLGPLFANIFLSFLLVLCWQSFCYFLFPRPCLPF